MTFREIRTPPGFYVDAVATTDGTFTIVTVDGRGPHYRGTGVAKKHPDDEFNAQTGVHVALSRALEDMAANIRKGIIHA